jgi:hypothetical protein
LWYLNNCFNYFLHLNRLFLNNFDWNLIFDRNHNFFFFNLNIINSNNFLDNFLLKEWDFSFSNNFIWYLFLDLNLFQYLCFCISNNKLLCFDCIINYFFNRNFNSLLNYLLDLFSNIFNNRNLNFDNFENLNLSFNYFLNYLRNHNNFFYNSWNNNYFLDYFLDFNNSWNLNHSLNNFLYNNSNWLHNLLLTYYWNWNLFDDFKWDFFFIWNNFFNFTRNNLNLVLNIRLIKLNYNRNLLFNNKRNNFFNVNLFCNNNFLNKWFLDNSLNFHNDFLFIPFHKYCLSFFIRFGNLLN